MVCHGGSWFLLIGLLQGGENDATSRTKAEQNRDLSCDDTRDKQVTTVRRSGRLSAKMLSILAEIKIVSGYKLYAYCLMENHAHFLIKEGDEQLSQVFR